MERSNLETEIEILKDSQVLVRQTELTEAGKVKGKDYFLLWGHDHRTIEIHHIISKGVK